ncbi:MAG: prepilin-type N-terminal cleavage/methylation domain-containing protein [Acidobacteriota bacterium]
MDISKKQRKQQSSESGMTLIEVTISTIILGIVLVGLGQALTLGIKMNTESKMRVASLNTCKHIAEDMKTQISQSQPVFDGTAASNSTYYVDTDGNKTYTGTGTNKVYAFTSSSAFRVNVVVLNNNDLTQTVAGVTSVLVKVLSVTVVDVQNIGKNGRETSMTVEIIRPSA